MLAAATHRYTTVCLAGVLCLVLLPAAAPSETSRRPDGDGDVQRVLLLNSYNQAYEWTAGMVEGAIDAFHEFCPDAVIHVEYMDSKRFWTGQDGVFAEGLVELYQRKYHDTQPDVIVCSDDNAFQFLLRRRDELFPGAPVVFCGVNSFRPSMIEGVEGFTGVVEKLDQKATIELALQLSPQAQRVVIVTDTSATGLENLQYLKKLEKVFTGQADFVFLDPAGTGMMLPEVLDRLRELEDRSVVLYMDFFRQADGSYLDPADTISKVSRASPVPVYSMGSHYLGKGIVGGKITRAYDQAHVAARMACRILKGVRADSIPVLHEGANRYMFDARQLQRFDIPESRLPPGSVVLYDTPTFYEQHRTLVWITAGVAAVLLTLIMLMAVNIRRRQHAEETLRDSQQRLQVIFDAASAGIAQVRGDGTFLLVNQGLCEMLGYSEEQLRGKNFRDVTHPEDVEVEEPLIARVVAGEMDSFQMEKRYIRRDGSIVWTVLSAAIVRNEDGSPRYAIAVINDQTEMRRLQAELLQSQKMEAIGRLAGGVAHDFNNKLQSILGYADLLLDRLDPQSEYRDDLEEVRSAARQSAQLTAQLLAFARRQAVSPEVLDLDETVEGMLKMLQRLIGEDIELRWEPGAHWPVRIDPTQLDQVLANLVVNARDAIEGVGTITIATSGVGIDLAYCHDHPDAEPGQYVRLTVRDDGKGMDPETLETIFEPFFTTKGASEGTGLGLATVYGVVRQNSGFIDVRSEPGKGSTFEIYLPRREEEPTPTPRSEPRRAAHRGHETVLFVEDEPAILQLGKTMLEELGYRVLTAERPEAAMRTAERHEGPIHLLITDVVMPGMNGKDLSRRLLARNPGMSRLFVSGYTADVIAHRGVLEDGVHFIQKPFTQADLAAKAREALDEQ